MKSLELLILVTSEANFISTWSCFWSLFHSRLHPLTQVSLLPLPFTLCPWLYRQLQGILLRFWKLPGKKPDHTSLWHTSITIVTTWVHSAGDEWWMRGVCLKTRTDCWCYIKLGATTLQCLHTTTSPYYNVFTLQHLHTAMSSYFMCYDHMHGNHTPGNEAICMVRVNDAIWVCWSIHNERARPEVAFWKENLPYQMHCQEYTKCTVPNFLKWLQL